MSKRPQGFPLPYFPEPEENDHLFVETQKDAINLYTVVGEHWPSLCQILTLHQQELNQLLIHLLLTSEEGQHFLARIATEMNAFPEAG